MSILTIVNVPVMVSLIYFNTIHLFIPGHDEC